MIYLTRLFAWKRTIKVYLLTMWHVRFTVQVDHFVCVRVHINCLHAKCLLFLRWKYVQAIHLLIIWWKNIEPGEINLDSKSTISNFHEKMENWQRVDMRDGKNVNLRNIKLVSNYQLMGVIHKGCIGEIG